MLTPVLLLGVKERHDRLSLWIDRGLASAFMPIATWTSQTQVFRDSGSSCGDWDNMLDFECSYGQRFGCEAVSTTVLELLANLLSESRGNVETHDATVVLDSKFCRV